jgi:hypothetical protein
MTQLTVEEYPVPGGGPYAVTTGPDDASGTHSSTVDRSADWSPVASP